MAEPTPQEIADIMAAVPDADIVVKQNDTWPAKAIQLTRRTRSGTAPVDLTGAEDVKLHIVKLDRSVRVTNGDCSVEGDPTDGWIEWAPEDGDTAHPGIYDAEADIDYGSDKRETVPSDSYMTLVIVPSLDPEPEP